MEGCCGCMCRLEGTCCCENVSWCPVAAAVGLTTGIKVVEGGKPPIGDWKLVENGPAASGAGVRKFAHPTVSVINEFRAMEDEEEIVSEETRVAHSSVEDELSGEWYIWCCGCWCDGEE